MTVPADSSGVPSLPELKAALDIRDDDDDARLAGALAAAIEVVEQQVSAEYVPLSTRTGPAMKMALIEFVRDMWAGGGPRGEQVNEQGRPVYGRGRPLLPPYVRGLIAHYMPPTGAPSHSFPTAATWPLPR